MEKEYSIQLIVLKTESLHAEELNWIPILYHSQKLTGNKLKT